MIINALHQGFATPKLMGTALKCSPATGPCYLCANNSSKSPPTSVALSTIPFALRESTIQSNRLLPEISVCTSGANIISDSAMSTSSAGLLNSDIATRGSATQMKIINPFRCWRGTKEGEG